MDVFSTLSERSRNVIALTGILILTLSLVLIVFGSNIQLDQESSELIEEVNENIRADMLFHHKTHSIH